VGRHRWTSRLTVEKCPLFLCAKAFHKAGLFTLPLGAIATISWPDSSRRLGKLDCRLDHGGTTGPALYIRPQLIRFGVPVVEQTITVAAARPHLGGKRYWFSCSCGKRAGRLYLPPGQRVFRCRQCYNLTYESAQQHDQRVYDLANNPAAMRLALQGHGGGNWRRFLLGMDALILSLDRCRRAKKKLDKMIGPRSGSTLDSPCY
jgi:hypothetical protein